MRIKSGLMGIAIFATVGMISTDVFAQAANGNPGSGGATPSTVGNSASQNNPGRAPSTTGESGLSAQPSGRANDGNWSSSNVTIGRPFGTIDVTGAGSTSQSVGTWMRGRTEAERSELVGRCGVINSASGSNRYPTQAEQFCRNYTSASSGPDNTTTR
jgi:hypothetical protein